MILQNQMKKIHPYVRFNDNKCREAFTFYKECLGGELTFQTVDESPMAKDMPAETHNRIMQATLKADGAELFGSDMMMDKATVGDNIVVSLNLEDEADANKIFNALSEGGEVFMPMEKQFWGAIFGVLTDKYGVEWMLNCDVTKKAL